MKRPPKLIQYAVLAGAVLLLAGFVVYRTQFAAQNKPDALELNVAKGVRGQEADKAQTDTGQVHKEEMHFGGSKSMAPFTEKDSSELLAPPPPASPTTPPPTEKSR
jgi:hypothetical protein